MWSVLYFGEWRDGEEVGKSANPRGGSRCFSQLMAGECSVTVWWRWRSKREGGSCDAASGGSSCVRRDVW